MSSSTPDIFAAAMSLPEDDRASLAFELLGSLRPPGGLSEDDPNYLSELERRSAAYERGETKARDWEDVSRELREKLRRQRSQ